MPASVPGTVTRSSLAGTLCALLAAIGFSAKAILIKLAYAHPVDAATLLTLRLLFSAPFFVLMALWSKRDAITLSRQQWLWISMPGFSGYYLESYLDFLGLTYITAGLERLILFLHPTIVVLLSAWLLNKPIRSHHFVALALSYGGIALVLTENLNFGGHAHEVVLGGTLVFASGVIYAFYLIGTGEIVGKIGAMRFTAYAMLVACVVCVLQFLATHDAWALVVPAQVYWLTSAMAIISTVIPAWLMSEGIRLTAGDGGIGRTGGDDIIRLPVSERAGHHHSDYRCRTGADGCCAGQNQAYVMPGRSCAQSCSVSAPVAPVKR